MSSGIVFMLESSLPIRWYKAPRQWKFPSPSFPTTPSSSGCTPHQVSPTPSSGSKKSHLLNRVLKRINSKPYTNEICVKRRYLRSSENRGDCWRCYRSAPSRKIHHYKMFRFDSGNTVLPDGENRITRLRIKDVCFATTAAFCKHPHVGI